MTVEENKARPLDAYEGGAKVLAAISEVLKLGGSPESALKAGKAALLDLRPSTHDIPVYRVRDATDDVLGKP